MEKRITSENANDLAIAKLVIELGKNHMLRIEQWSDKSAWRVGLNWYSEKRYDCVCENESLLMALRMAMNYLHETTNS
jgi:hypothetical protein